LGTQIPTDEMMGQKIECIHNNRVERGYVDDALDWRHSSARKPDLASAAEIARAKMTRMNK